MLPSSCPFCEHANPAGAKFCNDCGSPLHLAPCRHCGAVNNVDDAQCYNCGRSTARAVANPTTLGDAQLHEVEERLRGFEHQLAELEKPAREVDRQPTAQEGAPPVLREVDVPVLKEQAQAVRGEPRDFGVREPAPSVRDRGRDPMREPRDFEIREPVRVNERYEAAPRRDRHRVAAALVAVIALAVPAGGYVYYELSPRLIVGSGGQVVQASPEPPPASSPIDATVEQRASAPGSPIAALSQTGGGPTESRVDAGVSEPPPAAAPAPEAAPETRCPPAVEAMALCHRMARAEHR